MKRHWNSSPFRVSGLYASVSATYIVVSDWLAEPGGWTAGISGIQTTKGLVFVLLSTILIYFLTAREMRHRKAVELQLMRAQRMEAVGQLTNGIAHDFNNFLTVIFGNLELIQQDAGFNGNLRRQADCALLAAERGADLTRRLLAFSRKQSLEPRHIDVNECLAQMKILLGCVVGEGVAVQTKLTADLPTILVDPGQLEASVLNLGLNARDAMPSGGTIVLSTSFSSLKADIRSGNWYVPKGDYITITVKDDGLGMSRRVQKRLLEPFFTTKSAGKGTGLGFPMAHRFVTESGGHVVVTSDVGQGTRVSFYFPIGVAANLSAPSSSRPPDGIAANETVLLVDNDAAVRDVLSNTLTRIGYRVLLASNANEALEHLAGTTQVDLLLTDIVLGNKRSGIDLINEVRHDRPDMPVLLISGVSDPTIMGKIASPAPVGWLAKPFTCRSVSEKLRELLDSSKNQGL